MARYDPLPDIPLQYGRPSSAALGIAGATNLAAAVADYMGKKRDEDAAAQGLVPYLQSLDNKTQGVVLGKLATENPGLFQKVASMLQPAGPDPVEAARQAATFEAMGYNPNSSAPPLRASAPPPSSPLGMLGGQAAAGNPLGFTPPPQYDPNAPAAPTPAGLMPLPTDPATRAMIISNRRAIAIDPSLATAAPAVAQVNRAVLPSAQQPQAIAVANDIAPKADVTTTQAGENQRALLNAQTTRYTHDTASGSTRLQTAAELTKHNTVSADTAAKIKAQQQYAPDLETGALNPTVASVVNNIKTGKVTPTDAFKRISADKNLLGEVQRTLARDGTQLQPELTPAGAKIMAETEPIRQQFLDLKAKLEPYKDNNTPGYFAPTRLAYAVGVAPDEKTIGREIANLELAKITGAMPYATKSRNFQYIQQIQTHLPSAYKDSPMNVYQKLSTAIDQFDRIENSVRQFEVKGATLGGTTAAAPATGATLNYVPGKGLVGGQ